MRILILLLFAPVCLHAQRSDFSLSSLLDLTLCPMEKLEATMHKKGYQQQYADSAQTVELPQFNKFSRDNKLLKMIERQQTEDSAAVVFETVSRSEFEAVLGELNSAGFTVPARGMTGRTGPLYQRHNLTALPFVKNRDGVETYCIKISRRRLPAPADITFAEDLFALNSHEYLSAVFGERFLKKDVFYFSENEVNKCSVIFPGTNMQVIFVWADEVNNRNISLLIIGGSTRPDNSPQFYAQNEFYKWRSAQGLYLGMSLAELVQLHQSPLTLWGWQTEQPGVITQRSKGGVDFTNLRVQLNCADCSDDRIYTKNGIISSETLQKEGRRAFISSLVLMPPKLSTASK